MRLTLSVLIVAATGNDVCRDFCLAELRDEAACKVTYCKNNHVCDKLMWTTGKTRICVFTGKGGACSDSNPVLCSDAQNGQKAPRAPVAKSSKPAAEKPDVKNEKARETSGTQKSSVTNEKARETTEKPKPSVKNEKARNDPREDKFNIEFYAKFEAERNECLSTIPRDKDGRIPYDTMPIPFEGECIEVKRFGKVWFSSEIKGEGMFGSVHESSSHPNELMVKLSSPEYSAEYHHICTDFALMKASEGLGGIIPKAHRIKQMVTSPKRAVGQTLVMDKVGDAGWFDVGTGKADRAFIFE